MHFGHSILILVPFLLTSVLEAQRLEFSQPEILFESERWQAVNPQWSPDGEHIAFSTPQYKGLYLLSRQTEFQELIQLTEEAAAGYGYRWSPDGQYIITRVARFDQAHRLDALQWFSVNESKSHNITGFVKDAPGLPVWMGDVDTIGYLKQEQIKLLPTGIKKDTVTGDASIRRAFVSDTRIIITDRKGKIINTLNPIQDARYHRATLSPDNEKLAFQAAGKLHLIDIDGTNHTEIGMGHAPSWSPDSKHLAYEVSKDDGHQYTSADIHIQHLPTGKDFNITARFDQLAVQPDWSPDGSGLIFTTLDEGTIYLVDVKN